MISKLRLTDFRNFKSRELSFSPETCVIIGPNASGKTNILEGMFVLAMGKSFRVRIEEEMINYDAGIARISGRIMNYEQRIMAKNGINTNKAYGTKHTALEVVLTRGILDVGNSRPEKVARKKLFVNGVSKRLIDFAGNFKAVLFGPWDLELVTASPSRRRNFLDTVLSQVDREYRRASLSYEKGLRQRNKILWNLRENPTTASGRPQLMFWDRLLIKNGDYISSARQNFIDFTNSTPPLDNQSFSLEYDKSAISEVRLEQYAEEEVAAATTLVGPHRDDFIFKLKNLKTEKLKKERELARFGSRGEQRMGVLWLKLAELAYIEDQIRLHQGSGEARPTLLLDDIFSELDHEHREIVMQVSRGRQTIITTADPHFVEGFEKVEKITLK